MEQVGERPQHGRIAPTELGRTGGAMTLLDAPLRDFLEALPAVAISQLWRAMFRHFTIKKGWCRESEDRISGVRPRDELDDSLYRIHVCEGYGCHGFVSRSCFVPTGEAIDSGKTSEWDGRRHVPPSTCVFRGAVHVECQ